MLKWLEDHIEFILVIFDIILCIMVTGLYILLAKSKQECEPIVYTQIIHESQSSSALPPASSSQTKSENKAKTTVAKRYGFTEQDIYLLAQLLCGDKTIDGDGEYDIDYIKPSKSDEKEIGKVLCVVMNRVRSKDFPNTIKEVVLAPKQFSVMPKNSRKNPSESAINIVKNWCTRYDNWDKSIQIIPTNHLYFTGNGKINTTSTSWKG